MADIITQLQTCLDQLATQFYATLCYLTTYHDNSPANPPPGIENVMPQLAKIPKDRPNAAPMPVIQNQSAQQPQQPTNQQQQQQQQQQSEQAETSTQPPGAAGAGAGTAGDADPAKNMLDSENNPPRPDSPTTFAARQRELARDLIIKEQQIEYLIGRLPGIGSTEAEQEARIRELDAEMRKVEEERARKARELQALGRRLEAVLGAIGSGIYGR
ncbi:hypothetical protein VTN49DRAFT_1048 [Thermomyces lanuginosus]|uniref:uncharacterized protein n=1 Tax=Thermomyces lanuginosus TaxID=5541 RepID=UPI00374269F0